MQHPKCLFLSSARLSISFKLSWIRAENERLEKGEVSKTFPPLTPLREGGGSKSLASTFASSLLPPSLVLLYSEALRGYRKSLLRSKIWRGKRPIGNGFPYTSHLVISSWGARQSAPFTQWSCTYSMFVSKAGALFNPFSRGGRGVFRNGGSWPYT